MGICLIEAMVGCESRVQVLDAEPTGAYFGIIQAIGKCVRAAVGFEQHAANRS